MLLISATAMIFAFSSSPDPSQCETIYYAGIYDVVRYGGKVYKPETDEIVPKGVRDKDEVRRIACSVGNAPAIELQYTKEGVNDEKISPKDDVETPVYRPSTDLCQVKVYDRTQMQCVEHTEITFADFKVVEVNADCSVKTMWRTSLESGAACSPEASPEKLKERLAALRDDLKDGDTPNLKKLAKSLALAKAIILEILESAEKCETQTTTQRYTRAADSPKETCPA